MPVGAYRQVGPYRGLIMSPHQLLWNPITGSDGCRAGDASDHAAAPPRSVMNSRRFIRIPQSEDHTLPHRRKSVLCITAFWPTRLPEWVMSDRGGRCPRPMHARFAPTADMARRACMRWADVFGVRNRSLLKLCLPRQLQHRSSVINHPNQDLAKNIGVCPPCPPTPSSRAGALF